MIESFSAGEREAIYRVIESRRDVRAFLPDPVSDEMLGWILLAAHHAPSVGFMQPWDFVVIRDPHTRARVKAVMLRENEAAAAHFTGERRALYESLRLEGIAEAPVNLCVTCDRTRAGPHVLGRNTIIDTDLYSTCCAVQNLWLAARAEGLGVGWVSILEVEDFRQIIGIPDHVIPVAYLCIGYAREFLREPELERRGWARRANLDSLVHHEQWASDEPRHRRVGE